MRGLIVNRFSNAPLHRQLEDALRDAIASGRLRPGEKLLSIRDLRTHLGVSRNTIVAALSQLQAEGYLTFVRGVGTFVAPGLSFEEHRRVSENRDIRSASLVGSEFVAAHELAANLITSGPFRPGIPALDVFPAAQFRRALNAVDWVGGALDHTTPLGEISLREQIARRLQQTRGIACTPDQVIITSGAQATFALIATIMLRRFGTVVVEEPGHRRARAVFLAYGARIAAVPVDDHGVQVSKLPRRRVALAYVTPSMQYPTGVVLSLERRLALLRWAQEHDAWIIEDDFGNEFNYTGKPHPALHGLDGGRRVLYVGTFSKVLTPSLRLGYVVVPRQLIGAFDAAHEITGCQPSRLIQRAVAHFMSSGQLSRHVTKMRRLYDERRQFATAQFARLLGPSAQICDYAAGLHFVIRLPAAVNAERLSSEAAKAGVTIPALSQYYHGRGALNGIVVGYAVAPPSAAERAIATIAKLL